MSKESKKLHKKNQLKKLQLIIESTQDSVDSFKDLYAKRGKKGSPTHTDQDILRAVIVFSCAGLDAFQKNAITNLYDIFFIKRSSGAKEYFENGAEKLIKRSEEKFDVKFISQILISGDSRNYLVNEIRTNLLEGSLQSFEALMKTINAFGLKKDLIFESEEKLKEVFETRNEIIHEMDLDVNSYKVGKKKRFSRKKSDIFKQSKIIIDVMNNLHKSIEKIIL